MLKALVSTAFSLVGHPGYCTFVLCNRTQEKRITMRSDPLTKGINAAPQRSLLKALGLCDAEIGKPLIGVVSSQNDIVPGHMNLDKIVNAVKQGVALGGGVPIVFPAIAVCDGLAMGHVGMKYSLVSRELICDSTEAMATAHPFDGLVLVAACDKNVPGLLMAAARLNIPSIVISGGAMLAGHFEGRKVSYSNISEAVSQFRTGKITPIQFEDLENKVRELGFTTGHSPQSKPLAQMGGLVATRSIGQFSTLYGGIEDMIVGMEAVFPNGKICRIKNVPRRAAGPDIRHIICGNEGALCFITEVTLKLFKWQPENNRYIGYKLDDEHMKLGFDCLREVMVAGYKPSFARLYDAADAQQHFSSWLEEGKAILIWMAEGPANITPAIEEGIKALMSKHPELEEVDPKLIEKWYGGLNWGPEQIAEEKEEIKATQNIGITTEVSGSWDNIYEIYKTACDRIMEEVPDMTLMGGHSSHSYINGTNMYFVYYYNIVDCAPEEEINKYHDRINQIICEQVIKYGGSIVHHHGLGKARAKYVTEEYGSSYYMLKTLKQAFDPNGVMNMGTLIPLRK